MSQSEAMETFDGVMLGDGGLARMENKALFRMAQSKVSKDGRITMEDNFAWLEYIKRECLLPLGTMVSDIYPKLESRSLGENSYLYAKLSSRQSDFLTEQYNRWYAWTGEWVRYVAGGPYHKGDTKRLPEDFALTPIVLAHWFIGDGGSSRFKHSVAVSVTLATICFSEREVYRLVEMLNGMEIATTEPVLRKAVKRGSGLVIYLAQRSVNDFFDLIAPHMPSHRGALQYRKDTERERAWETTPTTVRCLQRLSQSRSPASSSDFHTLQF